MKVLDKDRRLAGDEIGAVARALDRETTAFERMRLKRKTLKKVGVALVFYAGAMVLMSLFL